jgi:hypothetical protein
MVATAYGGLHARMRNRVMAIPVSRTSGRTTVSATSTGTGGVTSGMTGIGFSAFATPFLS